MPHPRFEEWFDSMRSGGAKREQKWAKICAHANELDRDELSQLIRALEIEHKQAGTVDERLVNLNSKMNSLVGFLAAQPWHEEPQTTFADWFFGPFRPRTGGARVSNPCAAVSVCDREHIKDVQAKLILGRHLSKNRFPDTQFFNIPLRDPDWSDVGLDKINALCVLGRSSMFVRCPILEDLDKQRHNTRFRLPEDDEQWRSKPVTKHSAIAFHHVIQRVVTARALDVSASAAWETGGSTSVPTRAE